MEIIHLVLGKANPDRMNGVNKVVYQLATRQSLSGEKVSVWGITNNLQKNYGERNFVTRLYRKQINPFKANRKLLRDLAQKKNKAVFHLHGGWVPVFSTLATFMAKHQIPYVFTPHGAYNTIAMERSSLLKKFYFKLKEQKVLQYANYIHCIGESEVSGLAGIYSTNKTKLLPYGFEYKNNIQENSVSGQLIFGFVGRLDVYTKGLDLLVDAFSVFSKINTDSQLWIVGDGPGRKQLELLIHQKQLTDRVQLLGSKFGEEKDKLIKQMHVFVHPSRNEGLPSSVLEASQFGVPSIVSSATNLASYVDNFNAGISIQNNNIPDLVNAMNTMALIYKKPQYQSLRRNAQHLVQTAFDWNRLIPDFNRLYQLEPNA